MASNFITVRLMDDQLLVAALPNGEQIGEKDPEKLALRLHSLGIRSKYVRSPNWGYPYSPTAEQKAKLYVAFRMLEKGGAHAP